MRFYTYQECEEWLSDRNRQKPDAIPGLFREPVHIPQTPGALLSFARRVAREMQRFGDPQLLFWVTGWGISDPAWHLYYKLRQSYCDHRLLDDAPGHVFLPYETEDLASFLFIAMLNYWEVYLLGYLGYVSAFLSNDEYIDFYSDDGQNLGFVDGLRQDYPETPSRAKEISEGTTGQTR